MRDSTFAILGSGFGLYGYLPALVDACSQRILLPERYRPRFDARPELGRFAESVSWETCQAAALNRVQGAVLALRPADQRDWVPQCFLRDNIERLLLEKPLAESPAAAARLLDALIASEKDFRIGYLFPYTTWADDLARALPAVDRSGKLSIEWTFLAHHFVHDVQSWKRRTAAGGGPIRFYGIQVIALLAGIGYNDVVNSRIAGNTAEEPERWTATFMGSGLPDCDVVIDTRCTDRSFRIHQTTEASPDRGVTFANLHDPFEVAEGRTGSVNDRRMLPLGQICRSLWEHGAKPHAWYQATNKLWQLVEHRTAPTEGSGSFL